MNVDKITSEVEEWLKDDNNLKKLKDAFDAADKQGKELEERTKFQMPKPFPDPTQADFYLYAANMRISALEAALRALLRAVAWAMEHYGIGSDVNKRLREPIEHAEQILRNKDYR